MSDANVDELRALDEIDAAFTELRHLFRTPTPEQNALLGSLNRNLKVLRQQNKAMLEQVASLDRLVATFTLIGSSLDIEQVLAHVMDTIIDLTDAERAYLMLMNNATGELDPRVARNWDRENLSEVDVLFSRTVVQSALDSKEPIITLNAADDMRFQEAASVIGMTLRSILCIPLLAHEQVIGVLYADNRVRKGMFDQSLIPLLTAFGKQAANAIANASEFKAVKEDLSAAQAKLQRLEILIDNEKVTQSLEGIVDTDYFKELVEFKKTRGKS